MEPKVRTTDENSPFNRFDPDKDERPYMKELTSQAGGLRRMSSMYRPAKVQDDSLSFRAPCAQACADRMR